MLKRVLLLTEERIESPASTQECVAAILETRRKPMVQKFLTAIRKNYLLNKGDHRQRKKKNTESKGQSLSQIIETVRKNKRPSEGEADRRTTQEIILEAELDLANRELKELDQTVQYKRDKYTVSALEGDVIRMETGLPTKEVFNIVVKHALRFKDCVNYFAGWKVESISYEDQIFITLMKVRQNYTTSPSPIVSL